MFQHQIKKSPHLYKKTRLAFTLVELIIVITILSILATIGFISMEKYFGNARDSVRVADIKTIHDGLSLYRVKVGNLLMPDNAVEIHAGNTLLTYQGEVGSGILKQIGVSGKAQDPKDGLNYIYTIDRKKMKMQLMSYLEAGDNIPYVVYLPYGVSYASDYDFSNRYTYLYGDTIGVVTDENKVPVQYNTTSSGIDILSTTDPLVKNLNTYFGGTVYENGKTTNTGNTLAVYMDTSLNGSLPCSPEDYDGYTITALSHNQTGQFTKNLSIDNGTQIKQLTITCTNGDLDTTHATQTILSTNCTTSGYVAYNNTCIENQCQNQPPAYSTSTSTSGNYTKNWTYSETPGECTFVCNANSTYDVGSNTCKENSQTMACSSKPTDSVYNTVSSINQTWDINSLSWIPSNQTIHNTTASTTECRYTCNPGFAWDSVNGLCLGNECSVPSTDTYNGRTYTIVSPGVILHGGNETRLGNIGFGSSPTDGILTATFTYSCNAGVLTKVSAVDASGTCNTASYIFNENYTSPSCSTSACILGTSFVLGSCSL